MCIYAPAKAFQYHYLETMFINEDSGVYDVDRRKHILLPVTANAFPLTQIQNQAETKERLKKKHVSTK